MKQSQGRQLVIRPTVDELERKRVRDVNVLVVLVILAMMCATIFLFVVVSTNAFANSGGIEIQEDQMTSEVIVQDPIWELEVNDIEAVEPPQNASEEQLKMQEEMVVEINERERLEQEEADRKAAEKRAQESQKQSVVNSPTTGTIDGSFFKKIGVINENGWRYTWYSSNVLHHYRTSEWTPDENGVYRDSAGNVVVACVAEVDEDGDIVRYVNQGDTVPTPFGIGKVYDSGCAAGTIDVYVNF